MATELLYAIRKAAADDDLEGISYIISNDWGQTLILIPVQGRLSVSRNANDESEVDDSLLSTGLFTYPVLQAADILAYKSVFLSTSRNLRN